ncbi:MAG TPA: adenylate/guanylate cyclase domain-containing protein [Candidatus Limnocylindrales bacterium]
MTVRTCHSCGAESALRFRLCGSCATPFDEARAADEIRRFATVVNSDLKGSTALGERLDPESLREVLTLYFDEMRAVFESHGGTIEKIIGDAIVAVFGLPVRHDDDALRAVEASAESQRALASLNDRLDAKWGVRLVVRTGVATGDVIFGEASIGQHVLTGDTMKISSAMEQNAPPLEVLIAGSTYDLVRDHVEAEAVEPVTPKGMSAAVPAYRLVSVRARPQAGHAAADTAAAGLRICPACGEENPEASRYCGMCGTVMATGAVSHESRKTVTLVFADPKPTTLDGEPPSAEALRDVMTRYFEGMRVPLERHGGTVEKFIGDAVMAVFGLPVRHEDDAVRAVRAAADMQAALPALNEQFRATWGLELRNHIGVNTGEVIAGDASLGQRLVTGDAVNTAARLEQAAGAMEIILGDLTYRLARDQIEIEPIPPLTLKGKAEPVPAYRLVSVRGPQAERASLTTPFVGRKDEMDRLEMTLLEVEATRSCQLVTVIGDAGVGKSRLVREFATRAASREKSQVLRGRCLPYGDGVTFWPIAEIVRSAAGISDEDPREVALDKITAIARRATGTTEDPAPIIDRVAAAIGLSTTQFPGPELFWGIRKLLEAIASRRPLVAIVDDIHVAAPTFLELLDHLLDAVHGSPILLLTTARRELLESRTEWADSHEDESVVLEPLSNDESDAIVGELLGGLEASVRKRIIGAAEGNPLYVEQITAMLVETGAIRREGRRWVATSSNEIEIPATVQALVAARLDALQNEERQVIDPASVIGLGFAVEAVVNLVPEDAAPSVPGRLRTLTAKQFVRPTSASEEDFYRFGHSVIKDAAYRSLLKRTRADLHERFVGWAEPVNRERGREIEFEEILGYHLEQAYRYRGELGPIDDHAREVGRRAAEKLSSAGRRAFGRGDAAAAANLLGRAAALLPEADPVRIELLPDLAEALIEQGTYDQATIVLDEAVALSKSIGSERCAARAELSRYHLLLNSTGSFGDAAVAVAQAEHTIQVFERAGDQTGLARAWWVIGTIQGTSGGYDQTTEAMERVIALAKAVDDGRLAGRGAILYAYATLHGSTPVVEAIARCEEYLTLVNTDRSAEAILLGVLAELHAMQGDFAEARSLLKRSRGLISDIGSSVTAASTSLEASRVEMLAGKPAAAEQALRRDYVVLAGLGETYFRSTVAALLGNALWALGKFDEAAKYADISKEISGDDDVLSQVMWRTVRAKHLARSGSQDEGVALALEAVRMAAETVDIELHADALTELAEVLRLASREHEQGPRLREALALYERKGDVVLAKAVRERLAEVEPTATTS